MSNEITTIHKLRRLEFKDSTSNKYWEITLISVNDTTVGSYQVNTHWGRIGTDGSWQNKKFRTNTEAQYHYDKVIREKLNKGYVEIITSTRKNANTGITNTFISNNVPTAGAQSPTQNQPLGEKSIRRIDI